MIAWLSGFLRSRGRDWVVVDVGGVGYRVTCPARAVGPRVLGDALELHVHTAVSESDIALYGFGEEDDLAAFHALTAVQGVGSRTAVSLLDGMRPSELVRAVRSGDRAAVARAKGVGPRTAAKIVAFLEGHAFVLSFPPDAIPGLAATAAEGDPALADLAAAALRGLGYTRAEAAEMAAQAGAEVPPGSAPEDVVTAALRRTAAR